MNGSFDKEDIVIGKAGIGVFFHKRPDHCDYWFDCEKASFLAMPCLR